VVLSICSQLMVNRSCGFIFVYGGLMWALHRVPASLSNIKTICRYTVLEFHSKAVRMVKLAHSLAFLCAPFVQFLQGWSFSFDELSCLRYLRHQLSFWISHAGGYAGLQRAPELFKTVAVAPTVSQRSHAITLS
jgi:hypothetical protein